MTRLNTKEKERRRHNIGFAKWRVQCIHDSLVHGSSSVFQMNICAENPPLRKATNRLALPIKFTTLFFLFILLFVFNISSTAQQTLPTTPPQDTMRIIQIIKAKSLRQKIIDSATTIETLAGDAVLKDGLTTLYADSIIFNQHTNIIEAFGNVHINDNDSIQTYAQYLKYIGADRMAYLKKSVRLTDKKGTLLTDDLDYNLRTGIANYKNGGKVLNGKTVLTSSDGVYFADTKDVFFKKNVHLVDPKYDIKTDSLKYNITRDEAEFITLTHIVGKGFTMNTKSGIYNLKTGQSVFYDRTFYRDSVQSIIGDKILSDEATGLIQVEGRAKYVDSVNQVTVLGNHLEVNKKENTFLAYNKPIMIFHKDGDSTYIAADTLFSGIRKYDSTQKKQIEVKNTLKKTTVFNADKKDTTNTIIVNKQKNNRPQKATPNISDTAVRYFLAFHQVRIFNDSLQSISDSLYYSTQDSAFKLFGHPLVWNGKSQIAGDTMYLYTANKKPKHLYVFFNSIIINETTKNLFNQIAGRTLNGYFKEGAIDYVRVKGSPAESIYYPQDNDSAYVGMNRTSGDVIDIYFVNKELNKVKFVNNVDGIMYPIKQTPEDKKFLRNFKWWDSKRPKSKLELFE